MPYGKSHLVWDIWQGWHLAMPAVGAQALISVLSEDKEDPQKSLTLLDSVGRDSTAISSGAADFQRLFSLPKSIMN